MNEKTKIIYTPSGEDDQDAEEVLLSDSEKFDPLTEEEKDAMLKNGEVIF